MTSDAELRESIRGIQESVKTNYASALPAHQDLTDGQEVVFLFLSACMDHLVSIGRLLEENHGESGRIIFRTLFVDSSRLKYMHQNRERLEGVTLAFELDSLREERKWAYLVEKDQDKSNLRAMLDAREVELQSAVSGLKVNKKTLNRDMEAFRNVAVLMDAVGIGSMGYSMFKHASQIAHTSVFALNRRRTRGEDGSMRVSLRSSDREVIEVGLLSVGVFLSGYGPASDLLNWDAAESVNSFADYTLGKVRDLANVNRELGRSEFPAD